MKQAKKRLLPTLTELVGSANRANRSVTKALAIVSTSNRRIARMEKKASLSVAALKRLASRPKKSISIEETNAAIASVGPKPVGGEKAEAVIDMCQFMLNAPKVAAVDIKALLRESCGFDDMHG